jgi:hypothetical protein
MSFYLLEGFAGSPRSTFTDGRPATNRARAAWRASLSAAQRLGMPFEAALAHAELGRHAPSEP